MADNCLFCNNYSAWKEGGLIVFEDSAAYSIFSPTPAVPAHSIIIPKMHAEDISSLRGSALEGFIDASQRTFQQILSIYESNPERLAKFYQSLQHSTLPGSSASAELMLNHPALNLKPSGYNEGTNNGEFAGQSVRHIHRHLFPRSIKGKGIVEAMKRFLSP